MKRTVNVILCMFLVLSWNGLLFSQNVKTVNGVTVVNNPKNPHPLKDSAAKLILKEDFSLGDSENLDEMIAEVSFVEVGDDGSIYGLDIKESNIKVFDESGAYVRTIGKKGQGPGELNLPAGIQITPDQELQILDMMNRRLAFFSLTGEFIRNVSIADKAVIVNPRMDGEGNIAAMELVVEGEKVFWYVRKYEKNLNPLFDINKVEFKNPIQGKINVFDMIQLYVFDRSGNIYYGDSSDYRIKVFNHEGKHIRTIRKEYDEIKVTEKDIQRMMDAIPEIGPINMKERFEFPKVFPPFESFSIDEKGRLIVKSYTKGKEEGEKYLDIFDPQGRYIARYPIKATPMIWKKGKMYAVAENDEGIRVIKRYSVSWEK